MSIEPLGSESEFGEPGISSTHGDVTGWWLKNVHFNIHSDADYCVVEARAITMFEHELDLYGSPDMPRICQDMVPIEWLLQAVE